MNLYPKHHIATLVAVVAAASAFAQWHQATHPPRGIEHYYDQPTDRGLAPGVAQFDDRGEWPLTREGMDARSLIQAACERDLKTFGADNSDAIQHDSQPPLREQQL